MGRAALGPSDEPVGIGRSTVCDAAGRSSYSRIAGSNRGNLTGPAQYRLCRRSRLDKLFIDDNSLVPVGQAG